MSLITDTGDASRLIKYLADTIPQGPHPEPHAEWVSVRLDVVQTSIDHIKWLERGNEEWRGIANRVQQQRAMCQAQANIAIAHLNKILNQCRTADEQQKADTEARNWLVSIGV